MKNKERKLVKEAYKKLEERREEILYSGEYTEELFFEYMVIEMEIEELRKGE